LKDRFILPLFCHYFAIILPLFCHYFDIILPLGLEDAKTTLEADRTRLQNNLREIERELLQVQQQLRLTQEELEKSHNVNSQAQNTEKELQARLFNEIEERERVQLQLHQTKKQVFIACAINPISRVFSIYPLGKLCVSLRHALNYTIISPSPPPSTSRRCNWYLELDLLLILDCRLARRLSRRLSIQLEG
jgi:hypothetical protein